MYKYEDLIGEGVSDLVIESLERYWDHGLEPGSFLRAVICNDLSEAVSRADPWNKKNLSKIFEYMVIRAPFNSWGSREVYKEWIEKGPAFQEYQKVRVLKILSTETEVKTYDF